MLARLQVEPAIGDSFRLGNQYLMHFPARGVGLAGIKRAMRSNGWGGRFHQTHEVFGDIIVKIIYAALLQLRKAAREKEAQHVVQR